MAEGYDPPSASLSGESVLRPAWLTDDHAWREYLVVMTADDVELLSAQWALAGGALPDVDRSWLTTEWVGSPRWAWPVVLAFILIMSGLIVAGAINLATSM
jgi:hypothetical protein